MNKPALKHISREEYLAREETAPYKSGYYQGEIFAMAGGSLSHNRIVFDCGFALHNALKNKNCEVLANDVRLWIKAQNLFAYPDLMIVCGKPEFYEGRDDTIINPLVVVEVLSKSTESYDRGEKFKFYRSIPTLQEYILVDQYEVHVEQFYLDGKNKWVFTEYNRPADILKLAKVDVQIPLQEIYRRVDFAESVAQEAERII